MRANEFVKKLGWGEAIRVVSQAPKSDCAYSLDLKAYLDRYAFSKYEVYIDDLKRLVESHEFITKDFESIEMAKYEYMVSGSHSDTYWIQVKQAIADVESINDY